MYRLKSLLLFGLLFTTFNSAVMAQTKNNYREIKRVLKSDVINVSADSLWAILRQFDKVGEWTSTLKHSEGTGEVKHEGATCNERICETNIGKGNTVREELRMFNDKEKQLAYELTEGAPGFVKLATNHWVVEEAGPNQSTVTMNVTMHLSKFMGFLLGKSITKTMTKNVQIVLSELKTYAETGEVSETKKKQIAKLQKKQH